jgi:hypothetical protein
MYRYQRINCENLDFPLIIFDLQKYLPKLDGVQLRQSVALASQMPFELNTCLELVALKHIQYGELPFSDITPHIIIGTEIAIEYFCGDWRDGYQPCPKIVRHPFSGEPVEIPEANRPCYSREDCRKHLTWDEEFIRGALYALWTDNRDALNKITSYLDDDLVDFGIFDCSESDAWFCILLGKFLQKQSLQKNIHIVKMIREKSRRRAKLLLDVLESIENNPKQFCDNISKYVKYFIKNEIDTEVRGSAALYLSPIASLLWEVARYCEIELPILSEDIMDRIITRNSIGLD